MTHKDSVNSNSLSVYDCTRIANDMVASCSPIQISLLRVLIVCKNNQINPMTVLAGMSNELSSKFGATIWEFAKEIGEGQDVIDSLDKHDRLLPVECRVALRVAKDGGKLETLEKAILDRLAETAIPTASDTTASVVSRLMFRILFISWILGFIMLKIVPEFQKMFEEFGIELPAVFKLLLSIADTFATYWFVFTLLLLAGMIYLAYNLIGVVNTWASDRWNLPNFSKSVRSKRILALVSPIGDSMPTSLKRSKQMFAAQRWYKPFSSANQRIDDGLDPWKSLAKEGIVKSSEVSALEMCTTNETEGWILRWNAESQNDTEETRGFVFVKFILSCVHVFLAGIVFLTALSIFTALLSIVRGLS
ncbi:MAG: hypothetical protein AB8B55_00700 [Mariniblastus sp.]